MNDPGLDAPISNGETQVESKRREENGESNFDEKEEERSVLLPSRWWFASTAFPLIAGTFGPMANAFSICALVENWRVSIPPGGTEEHGLDIKDPKWLIAINAVSLACALVANMSLLLNMARRLKFSISQPITIAGFFIASFLLIGLISVAGSGHMHANGIHDQALTQAYYYAIFAAGLYFFIASLMCFTVWGAFAGHYSKEFKLTIAQRTLMLQTIAYMVYLLIGALIFSKLEKWKFLDAVYFANFTLLTVGIGDYSPATHGGRSFLFPYAVGGIVTLGLVVGSIRSLVLERGKKKLSARNLEKTRKAVLKRLDPDMKSHSQRGLLLARKVDQQSPEFALSPFDQRDQELKRREAEFHIMRQIQAMSATERKWISLVISGSSWFFLWFIGALVFYKTEKNQQWTYFGSLYFSYTSLLTIGYGDFYPMSNSGKPFFVFWSLLAVPTLTILISNMGDTVVKGIKDVTLYLGEITVLPGEKGAVRARVRFLMAKITGGISSHGINSEFDGALEKDVENNDDDEADPKEMAPGLPREPNTNIGGQKNRGGRDRQMAQHMATDLEAEEKGAEQEAHKRGDWRSEDEHHYRYLLIKEIRKVYSHLGSEPPKRYSYKEWRYYLELLGQDEGSSRYHRRARLQAQDEDAKGPQIEGAAPVDVLKEGSDKDDQDVQDWSWMGNRSPLMGDKEEAEWLLERLVGKLEGELKTATKQNQHMGEVGDHDGSGSGSSGKLSNRQANS